MQDMGESENATTRPTSPEGCCCISKKTVGILCATIVFGLVITTSYFGNGTLWNMMRNNMQVKLGSIAYAGQDLIWNTNFTTRYTEKPEVRHMAYLKVHKTGSSSVQNIFIRFGDSRNLTFILASIIPNECSGAMNCISFSKTLHNGNIVPPPRNKSFEILCSHVVYNRAAFRKYLPRDTRYIGLVREPVSRLASAINFFRLFKGSSLDQFAQNPIKFQHTMSNNRMAFEFGFNKTWFPSSNHPMLSETEKVEVFEYVDQLMDDFDLIMINERLDESLVLMRRLLRWTIKDIIYEKRLIYRHASFREEDKPKLKQYLYLDYALYERAMEFHVAKVATAGHNFTGEVATFKTVNAKVNKYCGCQSCTSKQFVIGKTRWYNAAIITRAFCDNLGRTEFSYLMNMRHRQYDGPN